MDGDAILYSSVVLYRHGRWVALWLACGAHVCRLTGARIHARIAMVRVSLAGVLIVRTHAYVVAVGGTSKQASKHTST